MMLKKIFDALDNASPRTIGALREAKAYPLGVRSRPVRSLYDRLHSNRALRTFREDVKTVRVSGWSAGPFGAKAKGSVFVEIVQEEGVPLGKDSVYWGATLRWWTEYRPESDDGMLRESGGREMKDIIHPHPHTPGEVEEVDEIIKSITEEEWEAARKKIRAQNEKERLESLQWTLENRAEDLGRLQTPEGWSGLEDAAEALEVEFNPKRLAEETRKIVEEAKKVVDNT